MTEDLYSAIVKLKTSIEELNQKGEKDCQMLFPKLIENLMRFTKLFTGDCKNRIGRLDDLEAGLEMYVSPPGKRLQSITLLSGESKH